LQTSATNNVRSLGADTAGRTVTVSSGATLKFLGSDSFGNAGSTPNPSLIISGTVTNVAGKLNTLGNVTLTGGVLTNVGGVGGAYQAYSLAGSVTVNGTSASSITTTGTTFTGVHLGTNTSFNVADATSSAAADLTVSAPLINRNGDLGGAGGLTKSGAGTMSLSGVSTYTGATTVSAGTLLITGALGNTAVSVSSAAFLVNNGTIGGTVSTGTSATVSGTGTFTGAATINGALNPGNSPGFQSYGDSLTLGSTAITTFELGGLSRSSLLLNGTGYYDAIDVASTLNLDGTINVSWFDGFTAAQGDSFNLFDATTFNASGFTVETDLVLPTLGIGLTWDTSTFTTNGVISVVPEPEAALLGGLGLLVLLRRRRDA
jgi:MYXO-CTERM domain-containing protein